MIDRTGLLSSNQSAGTRDSILLYYHGLSLYDSQQ